MGIKYLHIIPKKIAKERGLKRYFTGVPCKRGHLVPRTTSNGSCPLCMSITKQKRYIPTPRTPTLRQIAEQAGETTYFTGLPCAHGHISERFTYSTQCVECLADKIKPKKPPTLLQLEQQRANDAGLTKYLSEIPCKYGHISERYTQSTTCLTCVKLKHESTPDEVRQARVAKAKAKRTNNNTEHNTKRRAYYEANKTRLQTKRNKTRLDNRDLYNERSRKWCADNREILREKQAIYRNENRGADNAKHAKRRARKLNATPPWYKHAPVVLIYVRAAAYTAAAIAAGSDLRFHVDHDIPLQGDLVCGLHVHTNLVILEWRENASKGNRFEILDVPTDHTNESIHEINIYEKELNCVFDMT